MASILTALKPIASNTTPVHTSGVATATICSVDLATAALFGGLSLANCGLLVEGKIIGKDAANNVGVSIFSRPFKLISGTLTALGAGITNIVALSGDLAAGYVFTLDNSGTVLRLRATGIALAEVDWNGSLYITSSQV